MGSKYRCWILLAVIVLLSIESQAVLAQSTARLDADQIKAGLRTTHLEEEGFVNRVVQLANEGVLPRRIVNGAFGWAKRKPFRRFQYFRRAVVLLAARRGIRVQ